MKLPNFAKHLPSVCRDARPMHCFRYWPYRQTITKNHSAMKPDAGQELHTEQRRRHTLIDPDSKATDIDSVDPGGD